MPMVGASGVVVGKGQEVWRAARRPITSKEAVGKMHRTLLGAQEAGFIISGLEILRITYNHNQSHHRQVSNFQAPWQALLSPRS
jgi:hypothetical protein